MAAWVLLTMVGGLWLAACGSSSQGGGAVASVAGVTITKTSVDHWVPIEAVLSYSVLPVEPAPKGVLPDPPSYSACIEWLGSASGPLTSRSLSVARRKSDCAKHLENLREKTLGFLMLYQWYLGEAKDKGIKVHESEVRNNLRRYIREEMPGKGRFQRYLSAAGMSEADALFIQRLTTYGEKVKDVLLAKPTPAEMRRALLGFTSKWVSKTSCQPGYVFPGCRQYHGPEPPP